MKIIRVLLFRSQFLIMTESGVLIRTSPLGYQAGGVFASYSKGPWAGLTQLLAYLLSDSSLN